MLYICMYVCIYIYIHNRDYKYKIFQHSIEFNQPTLISHHNKLFVATIFRNSFISRVEKSRDINGPSELSSLSSLPPSRVTLTNFSLRFVVLRNCFSHILQVSLLSSCFSLLARVSRISRRTSSILSSITRLFGLSHRRARNLERRAEWLSTQCDR